MQYEEITDIRRQSGSRDGGRGHAETSEADCGEYVDVGDSMYEGLQGTNNYQNVDVNQPNQYAALH